MGAFATLLAALALVQVEPATPKPLPIPMGGFPEESPPASPAGEPAREAPPPRAPPAAAPPDAVAPTAAPATTPAPAPPAERTATPAPQAQEPEPPPRRAPPPAAATPPAAAPPVAAPARPAAARPPTPEPTPPPPASPRPPAGRPATREPTASSAPAPATPPPAASRPPAPAPTPAPPPRPEPEAELATRAARAFLDALRAADVEALASASSARFSFDGETREGADAIRRAWREVFSRRDAPAPPLGALTLLPAAEAVDRYGKPPARVAGLARAGVWVALADLGGRPVVLFLAKDGDRFAVLGMHD